VLRIYVDFNEMTADGKRVLINTYSDQLVRDVLHPGLKVLLYTPGDLEVAGVVELDIDANGTEWWYGVPDWTTVRELHIPPIN